MNEADLEELAMAWFGKLGYRTAYGPDIEPGGSAQERAEYQEVILWDRFESAMERLNPDAPSSVLRDAKRLFRSGWAVSQSVGIWDSYCGQWVHPNNPLRGGYFRPLTPILAIGRK